jgi:tetrahydromethanopterin S-methyltransferase subunit G
MEPVMERQIDDLVANPHRHFSSPIEVLNADDIATDDKRRILESWKLDASRLAESTAENMSGGEESELREVSKTLLQLDEMKDKPSVVTRAEPRARKGIGAGLAMGAGLGLVIGIGVVIAYPALGAFPIFLEAAAIGAVLGGVAAAFRATIQT